MVVVYFLTALSGLCLGSFLNVVIYRLPRKLWQPSISLWRPRSHCPHCQQTLRWFYLIPVLSFILLKGRCAYCQRRIAWQYPVVEMAMAGLSVFLLWRFGISLLLITSVLYSSLLLCLLVIDAQQQLLPDELTLLLLWSGLLISTFNLYTTPDSAILGAALGYLSFFLIGQGYFWLRRCEGLGCGDYKLCAALGAWVGAAKIFWVIFLAACAGSVTGLLLIAAGRQQKTTPMAFGPYLAIAGWVVLMWPGIFKP